MQDLPLYMKRCINKESISVATSNFSSENKIGEGGFGLVYKVSSWHLSLSLSLSLYFCRKVEHKT